MSDAKVCAHHWLIETPSGPTSTGRCKVCGVSRVFVNGETEKQWVYPQAWPGREKEVTR